MKWGSNRESDQVEDRRASPGGRGVGVGRRLGGRGVGLGTIAIALVAGWIFGINPMTILGALSGGDLAAPSAQVQTVPRAGEKPTDEMGRFVASVLGGTEDVWTQLFQQGGAQYQKPTLVLFRGATPTACGTGQSAMGPFYCPGDQKVYIDLSFYDTLRQQLGAPGDFAQAYVIAHEVVHHVQNLMGITDKMAQARKHASTQARKRMSEREHNGYSVRLEL
jgi:predicted metalloprotease